MSRPQDPNCLVPPEEIYVCHSDTEGFCFASDLIATADQYAHAHKLTVSRYVPAESASENNNGPSIGRHFVDMLKHLETLDPEERRRCLAAAAVFFDRPE